MPFCDGSQGIIKSQGVNKTLRRVLLVNQQCVHGRTCSGTHHSRFQIECCQTPVHARRRLSCARNGCHFLGKTLTGTLSDTDQVSDLDLLETHTTLRVNAESWLTLAIVRVVLVILLKYCSNHSSGISVSGLDIPTQRYVDMSCREATGCTTSTLMFGCNSIRDDPK